ncbi:uracil-DNA glycosylase family protein [Sphingomonas mesophila]|uniref:uracil-DNA glycosylase family protein n=1 Tax=Sphingomonas mesophila TaxID=2303576 RepID=UPI000E57B94A|nr:uracil-DNA glycosylase family protein [Sphingomonas mesophila]
MGGDATTLDQRAAAELLGWWLEAGVDVAVDEAPRDWLKDTAVVSSTPVAEADNSQIPADFAAFRTWLEQCSDLPLAKGGTVRAAPRGEKLAEIMLLTDMAALDSQSEPIGGEAWELARKMLAAIGFAPEQAYLANLSCFSGPGVRLGGADLERCAEIARQHIALAAPKRLVLFGDAPAKALLGGTVVQRRGKIHKVEGVRTIATFAPAWLLSRPADKALAWRDLLMLMEE